MPFVEQLRKYHPLFTLEQEVKITSNNTSQVTSPVNYALKNVHVFLYIYIYTFQNESTKMFCATLLL